MIFTNCVVASVPADYIDKYPGYENVFLDDFEGTELNHAYWSSVKEGAGGFPPFGGNNEGQTYVDEAVTVENGNLILKTTKTDNPVGGVGSYATSGRITTYDSNEPALLVKPGSIVEASIKFSNVPTTFAAFWLLPKMSDRSGWPVIGEIDIAEHWGTAPDRDGSSGNYTQATAVSDGVKDGKVCFNKKREMQDAGFFDEFHTYALRFEEEKLTFFLDGNQVQEVTKENHGPTCGGTPGQWWPFAEDKEWFIILNAALDNNIGYGKVGGEEPLPSDAQMEVDYVTVYKSTGSGAYEEETTELPIETEAESSGYGSNEPEESSGYGEPEEADNIADAPKKCHKKTQ